MVNSYVEAETQSALSIVSAPGEAQPQQQQQLREAEELYRLEDILGKDSPELKTMPLQGRSNAKDRRPLDRGRLVHLIDAQHLERCSTSGNLSLRNTGATGEINGSTFWIRAFLPAFLLSASSRIREAEVGAAGLEASALYPADRDKTFIIKSHLALWNQHKGRGGREEGEVKWDDVWEAGGSKTAPAKVAWDQIQRSLQGKVQRLKSHLFPRNKEHVEQVYKILKQRLLKEPLWWQEVVWGEVPPLEYWIPEDQVSPLTEAVADTGKAPAPPPSLAKAVMDTRKAPPRAPPPSVAKAAMDTRKAPAPPPSLAKAA
eukprot:Cvel_16312.t1-p1 / transcript=Cvel_16312.t1 / gene=Cvel_16312 / organism=Chromera_velia_CCMP2878 / gene_product=hypothetical protein / transcript_product=hypothetical protein / location=Cvel_scaffold1251:50446-51482(+) / protein_length=315 / sequence_SO=supercontig / SO=protein_coding / is_pseudo=false